MRTKLIGLIIGLAAILSPVAAAQTPTTFTFQGRLDFEGAPYTGTADYRFTLFDAASAGTMVGTPDEAEAVSVDEGLFTAALDFGQAAHGPSRYLQIEVRTPAWDGAGDEPPYYEFPERTPMTPAPYALRTRGIFVNEAGTRIGIGTENPKQALHNTADYYGRGHMWFHAFEGDGASGTAYLQARDDSGSSSIGFQLRSQSSGQVIDALRITPNGNVGVGLGTPQDRLHLTTGALRFPNGTRQTTAFVTFSRSNVTLDFPVMPSGSRASATGTLVGALPGDILIFSPISDVPFPFIMFGGYVPAPNEYRVLIHNVGSSNDPPPITFNVMAIRP